ncbi:MAG: type III pantothenate kinase [Bacteroidales bacterium]
MNLVVDIGNSNIKLAMYRGAGLVFLERFTDSQLIEMDQLLSEYQASRAIISSVRSIPEGFRKLIESRVATVHYLSENTLLPFRVSYKTPETLGRDRIAAVAGGFSRFPDSDVLVIDAGTAITFEFLSAGSYLGGNISPGIRMRFRALNAFTGSLPLVEPSEEYSSPGLSTTDAIRAGVINGVVYEINEYIRTFKNNYKNLRIILTGGDGHFLEGKIEPECLHVPELVTDGLNFILEYNAQ